MLTMFKSLLRAFQLPSIDEVEMDYLNDASSLMDLEYRQTEIDKGLFRRPLFPSMMTVGNLQ